VNVLYVVKHFPSLSQTFVVNEVAALSARVSSVHVVSALMPEERVDLDPTIASRVTYLQHGYLYRYGDTACDSSSAETLRRTVDSLLATPDSSVPMEHRRRLWNILCECESDAIARQRGFLDALSVISLQRAAGISHIHCDFAEDNVKLTWIIHKATGVPFTFKMRAYDIFAEPPVDLRAWAAAALCLLTISQYNRDYICERWAIPSEKVAVIYDGVCLEQLPPVSRYQHRPFRIVSVSRLVEKKGFPILLEACRLLKDRLRFTCEIFGEGPMLIALQAQIAELALDDVVTLHGSRPHAQVLSALESASVFVLACIEARNGDRDGTPNSLLEAMARGIPVISTRLSGIPEIIEDGVDGVLVPPGEPHALADAIARIAADRDGAENLRRKAQRTVAARFRIERTVDEFIRLLGRERDAPAAGAAKASRGVV
jgi:colanic acid/amylovoran biosynthesis glycosyltransferase